MGNKQSGESLAEAHSVRSSKGKGAWYFTSTTECPLCSRATTTRERRTGAKPVQAADDMLAQIDAALSGSSETPQNKNAGVGLRPPCESSDNPRITKRHYNAALSLANRARAKLGRRPVKKLKYGSPQESECCTIANTIGDGVYVLPMNPQRGDRIVVRRGKPFLMDSDDDGQLLVSGGRLANTFANAFDRGLIPELIDPETREYWTEEALS